MSPHRYINGRILLREQGGVHRFASEVAAHLDSAHVLTPRSAKHPWSGRLWEQVRLPRQAHDGVLLNMAHSGPFRHHQQVNVVHDLLALTDTRGLHPVYIALLRRQLPRYITTAKELVTVSAHVAQQVARMFELPLPSVHVVPPGVSPIFTRDGRPSAHDRLGLDRSRPVVAALLDPTPRKNSDTVAALLLELQKDDPSLQVVVAGSQTPAAFARMQHRRSPGFDRAVFTDLGPATDTELATMFQAADVFVSLTSAEGFGLPAVEAAMCGASVVTTPVPSVAEHAGHAAVIVADAQEAATAVTDLLSNPARRNEMAIAAQEALGDLQWTSCAASLGVIMNQAGTP